MRATLRNGESEVDLAHRVISLVNAASLAGRRSSLSQPRSAVLRRGSDQLGICLVKTVNIAFTPNREASN